MRPGVAGATGEGAALGIGLGNGFDWSACDGENAPAKNAAITQTVAKSERRERTQAAFTARFASRDFLRFALFLWMMPRAAALSNAAVAARRLSGVAPLWVAFL